MNIGFNHDDPVAELLDRLDDIQVINRHPGTSTTSPIVALKIISQHPGTTGIANGIANGVDNGIDNGIDNQLIQRYGAINATVGPNKIAYPPQVAGMPDMYPSGYIPAAGQTIKGTKNPAIIGNDAKIVGNPTTSPYNNHVNIANTVNTVNTVEAGANPGIRRRKKELPKTKPAFVMKIWLMVNDPENSRYIRWSDDGKLFHVFHREDFMKNILPKYFKHNNFASFVRQLNMYGWHKVQDINTGSLYSQIKSENQGIDEVWQFENEFFQKGREDLLDNIVRHKAGSGNEIGAEANGAVGANGTISATGSGTAGGGLAAGSNSANANSVSIPANIWSSLLGEMEQIKRNQITISDDLRRIRKDNKTLWQENYLARERHNQLTQTLDKILTFLATIYNNSAGKLTGAPPTNFGNEMVPWSVPMQFNGQQNNHPQTQQAFDPLPFPVGLPYLKPQLMLMNLAYPNLTSSNSSFAGPSTAYGPGMGGGVSGLNGGAGGSPLADNVLPGGSTGGGSVTGASPDPSSVEDIIRSFKNTPNNVGSNRFQHHQLLENTYNQGYINPALPRNYFPELSRVNSNSSEMSQLEKNIGSQRNSIQQVQDWIQKLSAQQQQQPQTSASPVPTVPSAASPSSAVVTQSPMVAPAAMHSKAEPDTIQRSTAFDATNLDGISHVDPISSVSPFVGTDAPIPPNMDEPDLFFNYNDFLKDSNTPLDHGGVGAGVGNMHGNSGVNTGIGGEKRNIEEVEEDKVAGPPKKKRI